MEINFRRIVSERYDFAPRRVYRFDRSDILFSETIINLIQNCRREVKELTSRIEHFLINCKSPRQNRLRFLRFDRPRRNRLFVDDTLT